jgi:hypothetical protein
MATPGHFNVAMVRPGTGGILNSAKRLCGKFERKNIPRQVIAALVWFSRRRAGWRKILNHAANFSRPPAGSI